MQNSNYNSYYKKGAVKSPYQSKPFYAQSFDVNESPIKEEVQKVTGTHTFSAVIRADEETSRTLKIPGLVAFVCVLSSKTGDVLSIGRGQAVISGQNKFVHRTIKMASVSALIDAVTRARYFESVVADDAVLERHNATAAEPRPEPSERYVRAQARAEGDGDVASDKQRSYLQALVTSKVADEDERERWLQQIPSMSRGDASEAIARFR